MKTTPFSPPSGPARRLFQEHPAKSKLLAAGLAAFNIFGAGAAHAALLVYEGFNYTTGDAIPGGTGVALNGQGSAGELGLTGTWTTSNTGSLANSTTVYPGGIATGITQNNNASVANPFNGMVANLATSGGFFGVSNASNTDGNWTNATDHIFAHRSLASSVTATFVTGNTTWFSFVSARGYSANARSPSFYIGAGNLIADRGNNATAPGIGGGGSNNDGPRIFPTYWNNGLISSSGTNNVVDTDARSWVGFGTPNIVVGKIEWNADTNGGDIISLFTFLETDELTMAAFDAGIAATPLLSSANWTAKSPNLDETTFNMLSIGGGRYFADEIRIATTFDEVVPGNVVPPGEGYAAWVDGPFSGTLSDTNPALDFDGGGLATALEWVLGGDPTDAGDDAGLLPTIDNTTDPDGKLLFVFRRSDEAHADDGTTIAVQYGNNLTGWTTAAHQGTGIEDITISSVPDGPGFSQVTVALPASLTDSGKLFARLNVLVTSP